MKAERALFVSNLFPSSVEPGRGRFNLDQLVALRDVGGLNATVVAPRPWFPGLETRATARAAFPPPLETVEGFRVAHPRAFYLPLWPGSLNGRLYGWSVLGACRAAAKPFDPDFLWVSFAFPDAVGADSVARRLGLPLVVSAVGSDVNVSFHMGLRKRAMLASLGRAVHVFCKSIRIRDTLVAAGLDPTRVGVDYNGVDRSIFYPRSREAACSEVGVDPALRRILFVGNLVAIKGLPDLLEAFRMASDRSGARLELVLVGEGRLEAALRSQARSLRIEPAVRFVGREVRARVASWMAASDVLVLPSLDEGVPNVVLEALACGRPVVASAVGGIPEVHPGESAGALVSPSSPGLLAGALVETLGRSWDEGALARLTDGLDWASNARKVVEAVQAAEKTAA